MQRVTMGSEARINVEIPKILLNQANERIKNGGFSSKSEYIRYLIRNDIETSNAYQKQVDYFNARMEQSIASGVSELTPQEIKSRINKVIEKTAKK